MPQLPTAEQLGTRIPQNRGGVVRGNVDFSGYQQLGQSVESFGASIKDRQDAMNLQKAKTLWQRAKIEADNAFDQDNDFETYVERYNEMLTKAGDEAKELVGNRRMQELLNQDIELSRLQGIEQIKDKAFQKEKESGLATLDEILETNRENALRASSPVDQEAAFDSMNDSIQTAVLNGYLDKDKARVLHRTKGQDMAIAMVEIQDLKTQREWLDNGEGPANFIPSDMRKSMLEKVNNRLVIEEGMKAADEIRTTGGDRAQRLEAVRKIKDPDVRKAAQAQVEHDLGQEKLALAETQFDAYESIAKEITQNGKSAAVAITENPKAWDALTSDQQARIRSLGGKSAPKTDWAAYHDLNMMYADDPKQAYQFFMENPDKFSGQERKEWSNRFAKASQEPEPIMNLRQEFNQWAKEFNLNKKETGKAYERLNREYELWSRANPGKDPGFSDQKAIMGAVFDYAVNNFILFETRTYNFELPADEADRGKIESEAEKFRERYGVEPTDEEMIEIVEIMQNKGLIGEYTMGAE